MKALLSPSWELSTESGASHHGQPVLVHRSTGETFGPGVFVRIRGTRKYILAAEGVKLLAQTVTLTAEEKALVDRFTGSPPPR